MRKHGLAALPILVPFALPAFVVLIGSAGASAAPLPPDLVARADQLRRQASSQVLAWVDKQGLDFARSRGPVDVAALREAARRKFVKSTTAPDGSSASAGAPQVPSLFAPGNADIEALAFLVLMQAVKSAQEDLKAIMHGVKAIDKKESEQRDVPDDLQRPSPTPTSAPDRVAVLVSTARALVGGTRGAQLSRVVPR